MNVSGVAPGSIQATTTSGASRLGGPGSDDRMQAAMGSVAQLIGMTTQQLSSAMASGQSLSDIASSKGVSQPDVVSAIKQGIQQATPQGATGPSGALLDRIAGRIANHHAGRRSHHRQVTAATTDLSSSSSGSSVGSGSRSTPQSGGLDGRLDARA